MIIITAIVSWLGDMDVPTWWWVCAWLIDWDAIHNTRKRT